MIDVSTSEMPTNDLIIFYAKDVEINIVEISWVHLALQQKEIVASCDCIKEIVSDSPVLTAQIGKPEKTMIQPGLRMEMDTVLALGTPVVQ